MNINEKCSAETSTEVHLLHADILFKLFHYFSYDELATSVAHVCQLWRHVAIKRMRKYLMLGYTFNGLSPMETNMCDSYPSFHWQQKDWLMKWMSILHGEDNKISETLPLPPLLLNEGIANLVVPMMVMGQKCRNEFWICGGLQYPYPNYVSPFMVQIEVILNFTKKNNTLLTLGKQIVFTVEGLALYTAGNRCLTFYDVPFASLSLATTPTIASIRITKSSPEHKWFYFGLPPVFAKDWKFDEIDCNSLQGTFDLAKEWKKIVDNEEVYYNRGEDSSDSEDSEYSDYTTSSEDEKNSRSPAGYFPLPPLVITFENGEQGPVCMMGERIRNDLYFDAKAHPLAPKSMQYREYLFKMELHLTTRNNKSIRCYAECVKSLGDLYSIRFDDVPWSKLSYSAPRVSVEILPTD